MSEEQIKSAIRGFIKSTMAGDLKQALSFLAEDAVWAGPNMILRGAQEIKNYLERLNKVAKDYKVTENGIGIIVQGNTGVIEHNLAGTTDGMKWEVPAMCIYEFKGEKIQNIRTFFDRLSQAKQAARGLIARWMVRTIANATEKRLR